MSVQLVSETAGASVAFAAAQPEALEIGKLEAQPLFGANLVAAPTPKVGMDFTQS